MNRKLLIVCGVLTLCGLLIAGCSKQTKRVANKELQEEFKNAPEWVLTGHVDDVMSDVGSAKIGKGDSSSPGTTPWPRAGGNSPTSFR